MKVAMLGWEFPPFVAGGLGVHCLELTKSLAKQGIEIDFYMPRIEGTNGPLDIARRHGHLRIIEVDAEGGMDPYGRRTDAYDRDFDRSVMLYNKRLLETFSSHDADVIHSHDWITGPAAITLRQRTGKPLVATIHSTEYDRSAGIYPQHWIEGIERDIVRQADTVIAVSRYTKRLLGELYSADPEKVIPIHNGIDADRFRLPPRGHSGRRTVLFLARLSRQKGPLYFLKAARRVLQVRPDTDFVIAGQGEMMPECIEYTIENQIADRVRFAGFVPDEELPAFYGRHEVYVLPSVSEPFGISVLEAMATGVPTIVTSTSGVGEGLQHALKAAYWDVDEMADMIIRLLDSPELHDELSASGAREIQKFTWASTASHTIGAYRHAVDTARTQHHHLHHQPSSLSMTAT